MGPAQYHIEVCVDSMESLHEALHGGATRIELCSSLQLGGLTPSFGFMIAASKSVAERRRQHSKTISIHAMIRPRQGDFLYSQDDINAMLFDIDAAAKAGLHGVVFGTLTAEGNVDKILLKQLVDRAVGHGLGITFHRAIDHCRDYRQAIMDISSVSMEPTMLYQQTSDDDSSPHGNVNRSCIDGVERILSSGLAPTASEGIEVLKDMVKLSKTKGIIIMAGAGVNKDNVRRIVEETGVSEVHLSGKTVRESHMNMNTKTSAAATTTRTTRTTTSTTTTSMKKSNSTVKMGSIDDSLIPVANRNAISAVVKALNCTTSLQEE